MNTEHKDRTNEGQVPVGQQSLTYQLDSLADKYLGTRKALYQILSECLALILDISGDDEKERELEAFLASKNLKAIGDNRIFRQVVKAVVGPNDKKAAKYAKVLIKAAQANQKPGEVADWIQNNGGIDAIASGAEEEGPGDQLESDAGHGSGSGAGDEPESDADDTPDSDVGNQPESGTGNESGSGTSNAPDFATGNESGPDRGGELESEPEMSDEQIIYAACQLILDLDSCGQIQRPACIMSQNDLVVLVGRQATGNSIEILEFEPDQEVLDKICKKAHGSLLERSIAMNDETENASRGGEHVIEVYSESQHQKEAA